MKQTLTRPIAVAGLVGLLALVAPARAAADVLFTPFAGITFIDFVDKDSRKGTFGASIGVGGVVGIEFEAARTLLGSYTGIPVVDLNAHVTTFMGNLVLRMPRGPIQPYVSGGAGIVRLTGSVNVPIVGNLVSASADDFGWNFGGGLMLFPTSNFGLRGDIRRFQTGDLSWNEITDIGGLDDLPLPKVDFWRATAGVTFKF
jgi:opacity protein-like surface antigen